MSAVVEPGDAELLKRWGRGDDDSGRILVARHAPSILRFIRRRTLVDAEDIAQRSFEIALRSRERIRRQQSFRAFVFGIARNLLLKQRDARDDVELLGELWETQESPSQFAARREEQDLLLRCMRKLPVTLQQTLELHYWENLTTKEIADILDVAVGTVKWRLVRARELLQQSLERSDAPAALRNSTLRGLTGWGRGAESDDL